MIPNIDIFYSFNGKDYIEVKEHNKKVKELEKEIERLNKEIEKIGTDYIIVQKDYDKYFAKWQEEKLKNDKAIDYLDNHSKYLGDDDYLRELTTNEVSKIVDILKGVDKE